MISSFVSYRLDRTPQKGSSLKDVFNRNQKPSP